MNTPQNRSYLIFLTLLCLQGITLIWVSTLDLMSAADPTTGPDVGKLVIVLFVAVAMARTMAHRSGWFSMALIATFAATLLTLGHQADNSYAIYHTVLTLGIIISGSALFRGEPVHE